MGLFSKRESKIYANIGFAGAYTSEGRKRIMSDANIGIAVLNDSGKYLKRLGAPYRVWYFDDWTTAFYPEAVIRKVFNNGFDDAFDAEREALRSEIVSKLKQAHGVSLLDLGQDGVIHPKCVMLDNYYIIICSAPVRDNDQIHKD